MSVSLSFTFIIRETFCAILTDNGSEFKDPLALDTDPVTDECDIRIFCCHPNVSDEKAECENNHALICRIVPKGTSWRKASWIKKCSSSMTCIIWTIMRSGSSTF